MTKRATNYAGWPKFFFFDLEAKIKEMTIDYGHEHAHDLDLDFDHDLFRRSRQLEAWGKWMEPRHNRYCMSRK